MNKAHALLFALMMMTVSLAGCFGGDDGDSNDETPAETLTTGKFTSQPLLLIYLNATTIPMDVFTMLKQTGNSKFAQHPDGK